jgi:hypothetical protein
MSDGDGAHDYALPPNVSSKAVSKGHMHDGDGHDYAVFVREGSYKEEPKDAPLIPRGPKVKSRTPSEKQAFLRTIQAAENRIEEARQENRKAKEKGEKKPKKVKLKSNWAKVKPGFNMLPAHIRAGVGGVPLRARGLPAGLPGVATEEIDYRELGAVKRDVGW